MIKTVKVQKKFRLDELIKYVRDNGINNQAFVTDVGRASVYFDSEQRMSFGEYAYGDFGIDRTFTVEVEEPITEDTRIPKTATITKNEEVLRSWNNSINGLKKAYPEALQIHAIVNGKLQLIWEAE